jgi:hypothetical protein
MQQRRSSDPKRVNVDFPGWMVDSLDREARRMGVTRQSLIKRWLAVSLPQPANGRLVAAILSPSVAGSVR